MKERVSQEKYDFTAAADRNKIPEDMSDKQKLAFVMKKNEMAKLDILEDVRDIYRYFKSETDDGRYLGFSGLERLFDKTNALMEPIDVKVSDEEEIIMREPKGD